MNFSMTISLGNIIAALAFLFGGAGAVWNLRGYIDKVIVGERKECEANLEATKKEMKDDFVCKNVCKILHEQGEKTTDRIERKLDEIGKAIFEKKG